MILPRIGWDRLTVHPAALLDSEVLEVVRLWQLWRPNGFGSYGPLPFAGGPADQPVVLLDALAHCSRISGLLREDREHKAGSPDGGLRS